MVRWEWTGVGPVPSRASVTEGEETSETTGTRVLSFSASVKVLVEVRRISYCPIETRIGEDERLTECSRKALDP